MPTPGRTAFGPPNVAHGSHRFRAEDAAESGFEAQVLSQQAFVARLAHRLMAWDGDVSDVVQEVFLAAYRHWPAFRQEAKVSTWLAALTLNVCRTHRRRHWLWLRWVAMKRGEPILDQTDSSDAEGSNERNEAVRRAVKTLPAKYREVIVLRYLQGLAIEEVAAILGRTRATIDGQLSRGREMLRMRLTNWMDVDA